MLLFFFSSSAHRERRKPGRQGVDGGKEVEQTRKKSRQMSDVNMRGRGEKDEDGKQQGSLEKLKKTSDCQRN